MLPVSSARDPYFLYAASNLGSMLGLLGYPFVIEPGVGVLNQSRVWSIGYCVFVAMIASCAFAVRRLESDGKQAGGLRDPSALHGSHVTARLRLRWILLSFVPSSLMLGVTLHISTDIAAVPLLWVLPLALYLLTFVLAFAERKTRIQNWARAVGAPLIIASLLMILLNAHHWSFILLHLATFFCCAMVCHSALAETRPSIEHLTEFYLWISIGGMLGGIFNTLAAPELFSTVFEYPLVLAVAAFLMPTRRAALPRSATLSASSAIVVCIIILTAAGSSMTLFRGSIAIVVGALTILAMAGAASALRAPAVVILMIILWWPPLSGGTSLFTGRSFLGWLE